MEKKEDFAQSVQRQELRHQIRKLIDDVESKFNNVRKPKSVQIALKVATKVDERVKPTKTDYINSINDLKAILNESQDNSEAVEIADDEIKLKRLSKSIGLGRTWTIIVYPNKDDKTPDNWREILDNYHVGWIEGPVHDKDVNPDGTKKKKHIHIILVFDNKKDFLAVKKIADAIHSPRPQKVESIRGMVRYLIHIDNPEKAQYDKKDIKLHGGVDDIDHYFESQGSRREILKQIVEYIRDNNITSFADLTYYVMAQGNDDWFDIISQRNTLFLKAVIDGEYHNQQRIAKSKEDGLEPLAQTYRENMQEKPAEKMKMAMKVKEMRAKGHTQKQIADTLGKSERTIRRLIKNK